MRNRNATAPRPAPAPMATASTTSPVGVPRSQSYARCKGRSGKRSVPVLQLDATIGLDVAVGTATSRQPLQRDVHRSLDVRPAKPRRVQPGVQAETVAESQHDRGERVRRKLYQLTLRNGTLDPGPKDRAAMPDSGGESLAHHVVREHFR